MMENPEIERLMGGTLKPQNADGTVNREWCRRAAEVGLLDVTQEGTGTAYRISQKCREILGLQ